MPSDVKVQIAGLHSSNNPFSSAPPGALAVADNCVLNATNVLEPRRGFSAKAYNFGGASDRANVLTWYGSTLLVQYASKLARDTGAAFTDYSGTFAVVDATIGRMRFATCAGNLYFNCSDGLRFLDTVTATPAQAGVPKGTRLANDNVDAVNGWQLGDTAVAYRYVWGIVDANGNEKLGVPSGRVIARNYMGVAAGGMTRSGSTVTVTLTTTGMVPAPTWNNGEVVTLVPGETNFPGGAKTITSVTGTGFTYTEAGAAVASTAAHNFQILRSQQLTLGHIPTGITTSHFFRIYRSEMTATAETVPSDELYLCYEAKPTSAELTAGLIDVTDYCPEAFLGDPAPWNANDGYGLVQANERPPIGRDLAYWDNCLWFANTTERHRLFLDLIGTGSPNGLQASDTITIAGTTFTFKVSPALSTEVALVTGLTPARNIELTARALVDSVNFNLGTTVRAYYVSTETDVPGRILLEENGIGGAAFTVSASRTSAWNPALSRSSDPNRRKHGLKFSKPDQPEAVPIVNEVLVGSANDEILRIVALKSCLIAFKQKEGVWQVTGSNGRYAAEQIGVAKLYASESVQVFSDKIWCLTDQGITTVTDSSGVAVVSYNIETDIVSLYGSQLASVRTAAFGVGYESDRRFMLWVPLTGSSATHAFNYSSATKGFTRWPKAATCGAVNPNTGELVLGSGTTNTVLTERKTFTAADYADETFTATVNSASGNALTMASATGISVGDWVQQGANTGRVRSVIGNVVTVEPTATHTFTGGSLTVTPGIACAVQWHPVTAGNPALEKLARQVTFLFRDTAMGLLGRSEGEATASFSSEESSSAQTVALNFDSDTRRKKRIAPLPQPVAVCAQLTVGFSIRRAYAKWALHGFVLEQDAESEKSGRR